jgi:small subunit ribosomal protein S13
MKKKKFVRTKTKKKYIITNKNFRILFRRQVFNNSDNATQNLISFIRRFYFYNFKNAYHIAALFGIKYNMKINFFSYEHWRLMSKITILKFYFNYSFLKQKKFEILKSISTFKSFRFYFSFPLRGQRTKTNAKTRKKYSIV